MKEGVKSKGGGREDEEERKRIRREWQIKRKKWEDLIDEGEHQTV